MLDPELPIIGLSVGALSRATYWLGRHPTSMRKNLGCPGHLTQTSVQEENERRKISILIIVFSLREMAPDLAIYTSSGSGQPSLLHM